MIWKQPLRRIPQKVEVSCIQVKAWNLMVCLWKNFDTEDQNFIEKKDVSAQREQRLKEQRIQELAKKAFWAAWGPFIKWNSCFWGVLLVLLVICLIVSLESYAIAWSTLLWTRGLVTLIFFPPKPPSVRWRLNEAEAKEKSAESGGRWEIPRCFRCFGSKGFGIIFVDFSCCIFNLWKSCWPTTTNYMRSLNFPRLTHSMASACSSLLFGGLQFQIEDFEWRASEVQRWQNLKFDILDWWSHKNQPFM